MDNKELNNFVEEYWSRYQKKHKQEAKYMGGKIAYNAIVMFLTKNSHGNVKIDKKFVVKTLSLVGVNENIAGEYYNKIIFGNYPQTA